MPQPPTPSHCTELAETLEYLQSIGVPFTVVLTTYKDSVKNRTTDTITVKAQARTLRDTASLKVPETQIEVDRTMFE